MTPEEKDAEIKRLTKQIQDNSELAKNSMPKEAPQRKVDRKSVV